MDSPARLSRFTAWLFALAVCFSVPGSLALAQAIPPGPQVRAGQNAPPIQALRSAPERGQLPAEQLLRLLELPGVQKALVLTDEQRGKIEDISFNVRRAAIQQQAALRIQRLDLERLMRADTPDRAAIDKKVQEVAQAQTTIMRARTNALMDLRDILTKEQRDRIRESVVQRIQQRVRARAQQAQPGPKIAPSVPTVPSAPRKSQAPQ